MSTPLIFLDTETTGIHDYDEIWELALIRREPDGNETEHHWFVQHRMDLAESLPGPFRADHDTRYDPAIAVDWDWLRPVLQHLFRSTDGKKPHVVGAVPNFDTERIAWQLGNVGWHYHLIDVENLAVGALAHGGYRVDLPWNSDEVAALILGGHADAYARHQALDDARWARDIYDAVMGR